jgi:hypothetical protein
MDCPMFIRKWFCRIPQSAAVWEEFFTQPVWNWNVCESEEAMRSTSSSLIFHSQERISTRNKKLSVRLSESITLFSFIAPLGSVWCAFLSSSCLVSFFLIQIAQLPSFWAILRTHLRLQQKRARSRPDDGRMKQNYDRDFSLSLWRITKASQSLLSHSRHSKHESQSEGNWR